MRNRIVLLAVLTALCLAGGGCGGSGSPAPGAAPGPQSVPRSVNGVEITQSADRAVYKANTPITISYAVTNNIPYSAPNFELEITMPYPPYFQGVATSSTGQNIPLYYGPLSSTGNGGVNQYGFAIDDILPTQVEGFVQVITGGMPAGTWHIASWAAYPFVYKNSGGTSPFGPGTLPATTYANPITIRVVP